MPNVPRIFSQAITRKAARYAQSMTVPRHSELQSGTGVNIVLKQDQPTGKLTKGHIQDILTRHDHPRGIKVRLTDGQIGRVQSLWKGLPSEQSSVDNSTPQLAGATAHEYNNARRDQRRTGRGANSDRYAELEQSSAVETTSLLDYVKESRSRRKENSGPSKAEDGTTETQALLEKEFPLLDSALIAAILLDHDYDVPQARVTLSTLSVG